MPGVGELLALRKSASRQLHGGGGSSWGHGSSAGGGCHHAALVTSVTSLPASRPQVLGCPRAVGGGEAGCGRPGHCGGSLRRAHGRGHGSISFRSDTAQRAARPSPGRTGTGSCCLLCPEPSLVCPVCLSVCLSCCEPQDLSLWEECLPKASSALFMHPPSSSSNVWLCRCSACILRKSKMFLKCFLFLSE